MDESADVPEGRGPTWYFWHLYPRTGASHWYGAWRLQCVGVRDSEELWAIRRQARSEYEARFGPPADWPVTHPTVCSDGTTSSNDYPLVAGSLLDPGRGPFYGLCLRCAWITRERAVLVATAACRAHTEAGRPVVLFADRLAKHRARARRRHGG